MTKATTSNPESACLQTELSSIPQEGLYKMWVTQARSQRPGDLQRKVADEIQCSQMSSADCYNDEESNCLHLHSTRPRPWACIQHKIPGHWANWTFPAGENIPRSYCIRKPTRPVLSCTGTWRDAQPQSTHFILCRSMHLWSGTRTRRTSDTKW